MKARLVVGIGAYEAGDFIDYTYYDHSDNSLRVDGSASDDTGRVWIWDGEYEFVPDEVEETPDEGKKPVYAVTIKVTTLLELGRVLDFIEDEGIAGDTTLKVEEN